MKTQSWRRIGLVLMFLTTRSYGIEPLVVAKVSPASGQPGDQITLEGTGFDGAQSVTFNGVAALKYTVVSPRKITVYVPPAASSGRIAVKNILGTNQSLAPFTVKGDSACSPVVVPEASLVITDLSVVNDARTRYSYADPLKGRWSFALLMEQMKPVSVSTSNFILTFLNQFKQVTSINGYPVVPKPKIDDIILRWPRRPDGSLDLEKTPMRLLAIIGRFDGTSSPLQAGEGRFVFAPIDPVSGERMGFTIILEYAMGIASPVHPDERGTVASWAKAFQNLSRFKFGEAYNVELQAITDRFALKNHWSYPNGSAINQVRTNEIELSKRDPNLLMTQRWSMREFRLQANGLLLQTTLFFNPENRFNQIPNDMTLANWVAANDAAVTAKTAVLPQVFRTGEIPVLQATKWLTQSGLPETTRRSFSLQTCNGCHSGETDARFTHISPRDADEQAILSISLSDAFEFRRTHLKDLVKQANGCGLSEP